MHEILGKWLLMFLCIQLQISFLHAQEKDFLYQNSSKIYYQTFGEGTPILILNGGPGMSSKGFIPLAKELARNNQTIIYDQRGTGFSALETVDRNTITMDLMVEDIEALRKHLGYDEWIVMGHSFGGILAYYYASKHPKKVSAMIQSSSGGDGLSVIIIAEYNGELD